MNKRLDNRLTSIVDIESNVIINIENSLSLLETMISKVYPKPKGLYIMGRREPFTHEEDGLFIFPGMHNLDLDAALPKDVNLNIVNGHGKLLVSGYNLVNNASMFSTTPHHNVLSGRFVEYLVDLLQFINNPNRHLYYENTLTKELNYLLEPSIKNMEFIEDLVYTTLSPLGEHEKRYVCDILYKEIVPLINDYLLKDVDAYYTLSTDTDNIVIHKHKSLKSICFDLAEEKMKMEEELKFQYEVSGMEGYTDVYVR